MDGKHIMNDFEYEKLLDELENIMKELRDTCFCQAQENSLRDVDGKKLISRGLRIANRLYSLGGDDMYKFCMEHFNKYKKEN